MVDDIVDGSERRGRIDIRVGVGRRRRWCAEDKGRIVAESYAPGAVASEVARRHEITPQHLFAWRKAARAGRLTLPAEETPMFVPVVTTTREAVAGALANRPGSIVIEIAGAVVRAEKGVDFGWLRDVLRTVKAAT
ncbi:MAG: transposase [Caldilineaceae bacterium]|nr:transposase [Caldilineaceae bacterium]